MYSRLKRRFGENAVSVILVGICVVVWAVLGLCTLVGWHQPILWLEMPSGLELLHRPWTVVTYMFVHESFWHLLFNMLWLWWFGQILLIRLKPSHLVALYICGGLAGALFYQIFYLVAGGRALLCGASAAVLAMMTAAAVYTPDYSVRLFLIGDVKLKWLVAVVVILSFLGLGGGNAGGESAHIGGALFGGIYGYSLRRGQDFLGRLVNILKGTRTHVRRTSPREPQRDGRKVAQALADGRRLDELLDKVSASGYDSLSRAEKAELKRLSQKL